MRRRHKHRSSETALANFSLTFAKVLLVFCVVLFLMISPDSSKSAGVKPDADYIITVEWPSRFNYDIDSWIQLPDRSKVGYSHKESGVVFLDRDDLGNLCDVPKVNHNAGICQEIVSIRGTVPGEYIFNLHFFGWRGDKGPVDVLVKLVRLNPEVETVFTKTITMTTQSQELHVARFTINEDGSITDVNSDNPTSLKVP